MHVQKRANLSAAKRLWYKLVPDVFGDASGSVAIYVTMMLPVFIGVGVLAVDASRVYNLHTLLQKAADALALAGAAELDRKSTAIVRSNRAINNLVENQHRWSAGGAAVVGVSERRFLKGLPLNDDDAIGATFETIDPKVARFVEVTVVPVTLNTILPASFFGGANNMTVAARAVAGFDLAMCQFTPMFMCNPFEESGQSIDEALKIPDTSRRQIVLRKKGGSESQYSSGNYGFLQPVNCPKGDEDEADGKGARCIRDMLALASPPACFIQNGVSLRPGFIASADQGLNVRFDMYDGPFNKENGNFDYRPARNVRKGYGYSGNACKGSPAPDNQGLPDDPCFATDSCSDSDNRIGDGEWYKHIDDYKAANNLSELPYSSANRVSRYEVYRYEIKNNLVATPSKGGEVGSPKCYTGSTNDDPDRRLLYIAVLDCEKHNVSEDNKGVSGPPVPVSAFVEVFLTKPVSQGPDQEIYGELVRVIEPGTAGSNVVKDIVQLYR